MQRFELLVTLVDMNTINLPVIYMVVKFQLHPSKQVYICIESQQVNKGRCKYKRGVVLHILTDVGPV